MRTWSALRSVAVAAVMLVFLYIISRHNYLLFHSLAEAFSIVIAFCIFILAWNSRRLMGPATQGELTALAKYLKDKHCPGASPVFLTYYLPGMVPGAGAWGTSHYNPDLHVKIYGMTKEEVQKAAGSTVASGEEVIGRWKFQGLLPSVVTIAKKGNRYYATNKFKDGSERKKE